MRLCLAGKKSTKSWSFTLEPGGKMRATAEKSGKHVFILNECKQKMPQRSASVRRWETGDANGEQVKVGGTKQRSRRNC